MGKMKKITVFLRTGGHGLESVILAGEDLKTDITDNRLRVYDGDDIIAEFQSWDYWKKIKDE